MVQVTIKLLYCEYSPVVLNTIWAAIFDDYNVLLKLRLHTDWQNKESYQDLI